MTFRERIANFAGGVPSRAQQQALLAEVAAVATRSTALEEHISALTAEVESLTAQQAAVTAGLTHLASVAAAPTSRALLLASASLCDRITGATAPPASLAMSELRVTSQNGEDGVLTEILRRIGTSEVPSFVEFGAADGAEGTCVFLADVLGWRGAFLELDPGLHAALRLKYAPRGDVRTAQAEVTPETVDEHFAALGVPPEPDIVAIDVDGQDYWIWRKLTAHRPRVVVVEYNAALGLDEALAVPEGAPPWDGTDYYGASLLALERLGTAKGYRLVHTEMAGVNAFFVREDLAERFAEPPARRGVNHFLRSLGHPPDPTARAYVRDPPL